MNEAFNYGCSEYLKSKNQELASFSLCFENIVVRFLIALFSESAIIEAYQKQDAFLLKTTIKQDGYKKFNRFMAQLQKYYEWQNNRQKATRSIYFEKVQIDLIEMVMKKIDAKKINPMELIKFEQLLYTVDNPNPFMRLLNIYAAQNPDIVTQKWQVAKYRSSHLIKLDNVKQVALDPRAYQLYGVTLEEVKNMSSEQVSAINKQILENCNIDDTEGGRTQRLDDVLKKVLEPPKASSGVANAAIISSFVAVWLAIGMFIVYILIGGK